MENGGFLLSNITERIINITASNTLTGYNIESILNDWAADVFRSASSLVEIDIELDAIVNIPAVALINHNIPQAGSITLKLSETSFESWTDTIDLIDRWYSRYVYKPIDGGKLQKTFASNLYKIFDQSKSAKYMRLILDSIDQDFNQLGCLFIPEEKFQFPKNYQVPFCLCFDTDKSITDCNGQFIEDQKSERHGFGLPFQKVSQDYFEDFKNLVRAGVKVFIPSFSELECFHGVIKNKAHEVNRERGLKDSFTHEFWENAF